MPKILIIEDEVALSNVLTDRFKQEGFTVLQAFDGEVGLALALKEVPDLILLDIVMPKMDGMEVLRKLRTDQIGDKIEVILLTNLGDSSKILEGKDLRVTDYLIKSNFKIEDVVEMVKGKLSANPTLEVQ
jgi:DNA-binding response OmpR family regulator